MSASPICPWPKAKKFPTASFSTSMLMAKSSDSNFSTQASIFRRVPHSPPPRSERGLHRMAENQFVFTRHAETMLTERGIDRDWVMRTIGEPDEVVPDGRVD